MGFCNVFAKQTIPNVDTKNPIIFSTPSRNSNDYFGHGVAIGEGMAIVGGPGSDTHGQIFKCEFNGNQGKQTVPCQKLPGEFCIKIVKKKAFLRHELHGVHSSGSKSVFLILSRDEVKKTCSWHHSATSITRTTDTQ